MIQKIRTLISKIQEWFWWKTSLGSIICILTERGGWRFHTDTMLRGGKWSMMHTGTETRLIGFRYTWYDGPHYSFGLYWWRWYWQHRYDYSTDVIEDILYVYFKLGIIHKDQMLPVKLNLFHLWDAIRERWDEPRIKE